jgi:hypothetical protein
MFIIIDVCCVYYQLGGYIIISSLKIHQRGVYRRESGHGDQTGIQLLLCFPPRKVAAEIVIWSVLHMSVDPGRTVAPDDPVHLGCDGEGFQG